MWKHKVIDITYAIVVVFHNQKHWPVNSIIVWAYANVVHTSCPSDVIDVGCRNTLYYRVIN